MMIKEEDKQNFAKRRPNSAGNRFMKAGKQEDLYPTLLASTVSIQYKDAKVNLSKRFFFRPEVESMRTPLESRMTFNGSQASAGNNFKREKALKLIQKHLRGYLARTQVAKDKELYAFLNKTDKEISNDNKIRGEQLKMSDLSVTPNNKNKVKVANKIKREEKSSPEILYDPSESKLENTQSILIDFLSKNNKNMKYETSNILDIEQTERKYSHRKDERDLDQDEMKKYVQESPLPRNTVEDEVTIISSRIDTNRINIQNTTMELLSSNRKNKLKEESSKIERYLSNCTSQKKNKGYQ